MGCRSTVCRIFPTAAACDSPAQWRRNFAVQFVRNSRNHEPGKIGKVPGLSQLAEFVFAKLLFRRGGVVSRAQKQVTCNGAEVPIITATLALTEVGPKQNRFRALSLVNAVLLFCSRLHFSFCAWPIEREQPFARSHCAVPALTSEAEPFHLFGPMPRRGDSFPSLSSSGTQTLSLDYSEINRKA